MRLRLLILPLLLAPVAGCASIAAGAATGAAVAAVTSPRDTALGPDVGAAMRVELVAPLTRVAWNDAGDSLALARVRSATGRVVEQRGDSLWLALSELRMEDGARNRFGRDRPPVLAIAQDEIASTRLIASYPRAAEGMWTGAAAMLAASFVLLLVAIGVGGSGT